MIVMNQEKASYVYLLRQRKDGGKQASYSADNRGQTQENQQSISKQKNMQLQ